MEKISLNERIEYKEEKFTKRIVFKDEQSVVFVLNFMPGQELPAHRHPGAMLYLTVLQGEGIITADGKDTGVSAGDAVRCEGDEVFSFRCTGTQPASIYVMLTSIPDERYSAEV
ncbi:cupin domain-containing protein [Paenibacillus azoreducens]|uniref:cupin domain-containing protein n=1 Tax=Paenibacillus azoreducens TaxID=116718 RepID=UPI0039F5E843